MKRRLKISSEYMRRQFAKAVGRSIIKILTEPITNADDSYRRLEARGPGAPTADRFGEICIVMDHRKRLFAVVDQAEGMTDGDMDVKLGTYGQRSGDAAAGIRTRSIFGKGLRDVLFTQKRGKVESIKDGMAYVCTFEWEGDEAVLDAKGIGRATRGLRESWGIEGNGTRVEFVLSEDVLMPSSDDVYERLCNFYMLRMINSNPRRKVLLTMSDKSTNETAQVMYRFPHGETVAHGRLQLKFDKRELPVVYEVNRHATDLAQSEVGYEEREGGLVVLDETDSVLDLTLFKQDGVPFLSRIFGTVRILGAGDLIRERLGLQHPEEILTETRDGFERRHKFYRELASLMDTVLQPLAEEERSRRSAGETSFSKEWQERHIRATGYLNDLYRKLVGRPPEGDGLYGKERQVPDDLSFVVGRLNVVVGQEYPIALLVNPKAIPDKTSISFEASHQAVSVLTPALLVDHTRAKDGIVTLLARVIAGEPVETATLTARAAVDRTATMELTASIEVISTPITGLELSPLVMHIHPKSRREFQLFVDVTKVPLGSTIKIASSNAGAAKCLASSLSVGENSLASESVARLGVPLRGGELDEEATITATSGQFSCSALAKVVSKSEEDHRNPRGGKFKPPKFENIPLPVQTWTEEDGTIAINLMDPLNKQYFGTSAAEAVAAVEKDPMCQVRFADLVVDEALAQIISPAYQKGAIPRRIPNDPATDIRRWVSEYKFKHAPRIHREFVMLAKAGELAASAPGNDGEETTPGKIHPERSVERESEST